MAVTDSGTGYGELAQRRQRSGRSCVTPLLGVSAIAPSKLRLPVETVGSRKGIGRDFSQMLTRC
jgi:hypothetical protein